MADKKEEKKEEEKEVKEMPAEEGTEGEEGEGAKSGGLSKKKKIILLAVLAVIILGGIVAGILLSGVFSSDSGKEKVDPLLVPNIIYYDLEEFLVNLNNPGKQVSFLKMEITIELPNLRAKQIVETKLPRIRDSFQVYLRELRSSDLQGSAGMQRLREELLLRINKIVEPEKVNDILFKEMIVQ